MNKPLAEVYWKFPEFLLSNADYSAELKVVVNQTIRENNDINTNPGLLWDTVKNSIRGDFLARGKCERKKKIEEVETQIFHAARMRDSIAPLDPERCNIYVNRIEKLQKELDTTYANLNAPFQKKLSAQKHFESNICTKFYFKQYVHNNDSLKCLFDPKGNYIMDNQQILKCSRDYYQNLYRQPYLFRDSQVLNRYLSRIDHNLLSEEGAIFLDKPISISELHDALSVMKKEVVPGEDGLTVSFYLTFWDILKDLVFSSFQYAFDSGFLSITQRRGVIKLIPKKDKNPVLLPSWRPITLLKCGL